MNKRINFEDNIYATLGRIRMIRDLLALEADPELFLDKTLEDIDFIDSTLRILLSGLLENQYLIEREELLSHISELEWQFSQILGNFLNTQGNIAAQEPSLRDRIAILRTRSLERRRTAENAGAAAGSIPEEPVVSSDEISELLRGL
ncbi:MAG: hypothetical protein LBS48_05330 [Treponema sp.]|jgi:hypothetical protein|nr:hypothetical protein [Treponema sp.]